MGTTTNISYVHHTFSPWWGCRKIGAGCANCYAELTAQRRVPHLDLWGVYGARKLNREPSWKEPRRWNKAASHERRRHRVLCGSMCDLFEDYDGPIVDHRGQELVGWGTGPLRKRVFQLIDETPTLDWLLLTKRIVNVADMVPWENGWPANVWLGYSVSTQADLDAGLEQLLRIRAQVRFLSCEPMLERIKFGNLNGIHWVIFGAESGPGRRPCDNEWIRDGIVEVRAGGAAIDVKQLDLGDHVSHDPEEWPKDLRLRAVSETA